MEKIVIPVDAAHQNYNKHIVGNSYFLFQVQYKFYMIVYPHYMNGYSHLDLKEDFMKGFSKSRKISLKEQPFRSWTLKEIRTEMVSGALFEIPVVEICNIYEDGAAKQYCFAVKSTYIDFMEGQFEYHDQYRKAEESIKKDILLSTYQKKSLKDELFNLYHHNTSNLLYLDDYKKLTLAQLALKFSIKNKTKDE